MVCKTEGTTVGDQEGETFDELTGSVKPAVQDDVKDFLDRVRYSTLIVCEDEKGRASGEVGG